MSYCHHCIDNVPVCTRKVMTLRGLREHRLCEKCASSVSPVTRRADPDRVTIETFVDCSSTDRPLTSDERDRLSARATLDRSTMMLTLEWVRPSD